MKLTELEASVLGRMFADNELPPRRGELHAEAVDVVDREFTGVGFLTELRRSPELKLFKDGVSMRWGEVGARLNATKIETGYLVYVDNGYVTAIEGYTYGDEWPAKVEQIEFYKLTSGTELENPPR
ncbi:MAG: hypothetical protein SX243_13280 [Acidobacteriota bacterium]|nr:hypothetical protein [Acidobacteriota bacterium]